MKIITKGKGIMKWAVEEGIMTISDIGVTRTDFNEKGIMLKLDNFEERKQFCVILNEFETKQLRRWLI